MTQPPGPEPIGGVPPGASPPSMPAMPPTPPVPPELPPMPGGAAPGGVFVPPPPVMPAGGGVGPPGGTPTVYQRMGGHNNVLGWLSLFFGIVATGCCCCWCLDGAPFIGGIPALILGFLHLKRVKDGRASMKWTAWVGIILAIIAIIGAIIGFATHWQDNLYNQVNPK